MDDVQGKFFGKYQIVEPLGEGGMATVYKAFDASLERYVAIKVIRSANQVDPNFLARFQREARALAKLDHPYILKVLDYGEQDGIPYLVMPFVSGGTLKQYIRKKVPYGDAIDLILPIAEALAYAHQQKIIHRDIKPANILFTASGEPTLSDFGIAKIIDASDDTQLTMAGVGIGTPDYMAPEQWSGAADERTDIYALGIVLYELITGRCPFHADTPAAILLKQVNEPLPRPRNFSPDLPEGVEGLLLKALAKDPTLRFQHMTDFIAAMHRLRRFDNQKGKQTMVSEPGGAATQLSPRDLADYAEPQSEEIEKPKAGTKKYLPWILGAGGVLVVACVVIIVLTGVWQLGKLGNKTDSPSEEAALVEQTATKPNLQSKETETQSTAVRIATNTPNVTPTLSMITEIDNFPVDVPIYIPNNGDLVTSTADEYSNYSYSSNDDLTVIRQFFADTMEQNGWELMNTTEMAAQNMTMYVFSKDPRVVMVYVIGSDQDLTMIQIMIPVE